MAGRLNITFPSDREVRLERAFNAPRGLVFEALTTPEILLKWNYGPDEWRIAVCEVDLRVGGAMRYVWRNTKGVDMGLSGVFREIAAPERMVHTEIFDQDWTGGETLITTVLTERAGVTLLTMTIAYASKEARDAAMQTPMEEGMAMGYDRLDALLAGLGARG